ncbi:TPA: flagellar basal body rod protein FlgC [Stenotrophomonas maltophilia]|nr:flagellar basal body rod protein FlgC [Stenotrophomonas maltophilia]
MSNLPIFDIAGSALQAQSVRMSTIASNLSNADTVAGSADAVYKPLEPIFQAVTSKNDPNITSVKVKEITQSDAAPIKRYEPGHPLADGDGDGYIYQPDVDPVAQMVNLISTSRNYQAGVEMLTTAKELALATLTMGR